MDGRTTEEAQLCIFEVHANGTTSSPEIKDFSGQSNLNGAAELV